MRFAAVAAVALLSFTSIAACQSAAPSPVGPTAPTPSPTQSLPPAERLVAILRETNELKAQLLPLREELTHKCMVAKGFRVHPPVADEQAKFQSPLPDPATWQLDAATVAKEGYGYGKTLTSPIPQDTQTAPTSQEFNQLPATERDRYLETRDAPGTGCAARVRLILFGGQPPKVSLGDPSPLDLLIKPANRAAADKRVKSMLKAWSTCMDGKGYGGLASTDESVKMAMRRYGAHGEVPVFTEARQRSEIKQATADLNCRNKVKMVSVMMAVTTEKVTAMLLSYEAHILRWHDDARQQLARAKTALGR